MFPAPVVLFHEQKVTLAGRVAEIRREAGVLPRDLAGGGPAVCVGGGGEGEIPDVDAFAGEIHGVPGYFLLPDGQSLPYSPGGAADGGERAFG